MTHITLPAVPAYIPPAQPHTTSQNKPLTGDKTPSDVAAKTNPQIDNDQSVEKSAQVLVRKSRSASSALNPVAVSSASTITSATEKEQITRTINLTSSSNDVNQALAGQPLFSPQVNQQFKRFFPNLPHPIDLNKIYVNTGSVKTRTYSDGSPTERIIDSRVQSSISLADLISNSIKSGQPPTLRWDRTDFPASQLTDSIVLSTSATSNDSEHRIDNVDISELMSEISPDGIAQELWRRFPNLPQPLDLNNTYINTFHEETAEVTSQDPLTGEIITRKTYRIDSSTSLADFIVKKIKGEPTPDIKPGLAVLSTNSSATLDDPDHISGIDMLQFLKVIDQSYDPPIKQYQQELNAFYTTPNSATNNMSPKAFLVEKRKGQLRDEADLRSTDGTLKPQSKALIDKILANPSANQRTTAIAPVVYNLVLGNDTSKSVSGVFVMATYDAGMESRYPNAAVVLYIPGQGMQEFDSLQEMKAHIDTDTKTRSALLSFVQKVDQRVHYVPLSFDYKRFEQDETTGITDVFEYSVQSQITQQDKDVQDEFEYAKTNNLGGNATIDLVNEASDNLVDSFDTTEVMRNRNVMLVEKNQPQWLKNATPAQRQNLEKLQTTEDTEKERVRNLMEKEIPSMQKFAAEKIKERLQRDYPDLTGDDGDPDKIQVKIWPKYFHVLTPAAAFFPSYQPPRTMSLTEYAIENRSPWHMSLFEKSKVDEVSYTIVTKSGKLIELQPDYFPSLVKDLNIGQQYEDFLNKKLLTDEGTGIRQAWKDSYAATMKADAEEATLSGVFAPNSQEVTQNGVFSPNPATFDYGRNSMGYQWVQGVIDHPNSEPPRMVNGYEIQAESFLIDSSVSNPNEGASVSGVLVIGAKIPQRRANPPQHVFLYTPGAPDGRVFREYPNRAALNTDPIFKSAQWQAYFEGRVSENARPTPAVPKFSAVATGVEFSLPGPRATSTQPMSIEGDLRKAAEDAKRNDVFRDNESLYQSVMAVVNHPDPRTRTRPRVNGHEIAIKSLQFPNSSLLPGSLAPPYSVNGVLVIGAKNADSSPAIVLYTPNAPDGQALRTYGQIDDVSRDPALRSREWQAYFKARVPANAQRSFGDGIINSNNVVKTLPITGNVQDKMYTAHARSAIATADAQSTTNYEVNIELGLNAAEFALDVTDVATELIPGKRIFTAVRKGITKLTRRLNPRKVFSKLDGTPILTSYRNAAGTIDLKVAPQGTLKKPFFRVPQRINGQIGYPLSPVKAARKAARKVDTNRDATEVPAPQLQERLSGKYWDDKLKLNDPTTFQAMKTNNTDFWKGYGAGGTSSERTLEAVANLGEDLLDKLNKLNRADKTGPQLSIYRGMRKTEADAIETWVNNKANVEEFISGNKLDASGQKIIPKDLDAKGLNTFLKPKDGNQQIMPIGAHLGDLEQAKGYAKGTDEVLMKFTLKPGAEKYFFTPGYMAVARKGNGATASLAAGYKEGTFPAAANVNEGSLGGYIGMKSESGDQFSLVLSNKPGPSQLLFQLFVDKVSKWNPATNAWEEIKPLMPVM